MYRILVVDDEPVITDGLYEVLQGFREYELDLYKAYSGDEALEWLSRMRVDIVISDIRMPGMNGLQLMENILENWPSCRIIFLTGYNDFDYVYKAIQNKDVYYLLKTEGYNKIIENIKKCINEIDDSHKIEEIVNYSQEQSKIAISLMQKDFINQMLQSETIYSSITQQQLDELGIGMRSDSSVLLLLGRIHESLYDIQYSDRIHFINALKVITDKFFADMVSSVLVLLNEYDLLWFIQKSDRKLSNDTNRDVDWNQTVTFVYGMLERIQEAAYKLINKNLSFVLGEIPTAWFDIRKKYYNLRKLFDIDMIGADTGRIIMEGEQLTTEKKAVIKQNEKFKMCYEKLNKRDFAALCLERGDREGFFKIMRELTEGLLDIESFNYNPAVEIYMSFSLLLLSYINACNLSEAIAFKIGLNKLMRLDGHDSWKEAVDYLFNVAEIIFDLKKIISEQGTSDAIFTVQQFIKDNLMNDISLVRLADLVHFNPSYLSRLFKQKNGVTLSEYIDEARIKKAKEYLAGNKFKIHEIAEMVGYNCSTNFGRFFKKSEGMTPQEYRELMIKA